MRVLDGYIGLWKSISRYWGDYGGWKDFLCSPLLHISVLATAISYDSWTDPEWIELPLQLLPNLLGFSLGAYALIFSLSSERLLAALNMERPDGQPNLLRMINATFLHFILLQTAAILFALINKSSSLIDLFGKIPMDSAIRLHAQLTLRLMAGAFGYWLTLYAVFLLLGAALAAYRMAIMSGRAATVGVEGPADTENSSAK